MSSPATTTASRTSRVATKSRHVDPMRRQQAVAAWVLALPFTVLFLVFTAGPVLASLGMSFTDIRSTDMRTPFAVGFVGFDNYAKLLADPLFQKVMVNTFAYLVLGVPLTMVLALAAAVGLNRITFLRGLFRVGYYLPVVTSIVAVSVVWKFLLREEGGLVNAVLALVGIDGPGWLDSTTLALPSLVVMSAWRNLGTLMIIFLAGLQTIPTEVNEASEVDGAGSWQRFRHITLPMLRPTLLFGAVITSIGYLQFFEEAFVWMVLSSLKPDAEVTAVPPTWWPREVTMGNYTTLFTRLDFPRYFLNSVLVAAAVTVGNVVFCSMLGYALAKLDFPGKRLMFGLVLTTLMIPGVVTFVPLFVLTTNLGLTDTLPGMFLPFLAGPFGVFLMRQFIAGLPDELLQAG